jgi:DeoR/GlpR family transcriptional regulator of sugar metabolism
VANAATTVLLADHNKFGGASLFQIVDWSQISAIVTDQEPNAEWQQFFNDHDINLIFPGSGDSE